MDAYTMKPVSFIQTRISRSVKVFKKIFTLLLLIFFPLAGITQDTLKKIIVSNDLYIVPLSANAYMHVAYKSFPSFGRVGSNGLIYIDNNEAVVMDTPPDAMLSRQLLSWFKNSFPGVTIKAVVVNHFHDDCLGGLQEFHNIGAVSYAQQQTPGLIREDSVARPQTTFSKKLTIPVGNKKVICRYLGEAHSRDNIVSWIPGEKILFGGCMVKSLRGGKGNLADANVKEWSQTVQRVKKTFKNAGIVIPGHGLHGGTDLLDYTIQLFAANGE